MDKEREAKIGMYDNVIAGCDEDPAIPPIVPAFEDALDDFKNIVTVIHEKSIIVDENISGAAVDKGEAKEDGAHKFADAADSITAFAASTGNNELKAEVKYSFRKLMRLADEEFGPACNIILARAQTHAAALIAFGITAGTITALQTALTVWQTALPKPVNRKSVRKAADIAVDVKMKEADELLKDRLDNAIAPYRTTHPDFYNAYFANRNIINNPTSHTQVAGTITNSVTNEGIFEVEVKATKDGVKFYTILSLVNGVYSLKIPIPGVYTITFTKMGFQTKQVINVEVKLGQTTVVDVELVGV